MTALEWLMNAHYHLMDDQRFWYDKGMKEASKILCVIASDIRHGDYPKYSQHLKLKGDCERKGDKQ